MISKAKIKFIKSLQIKKYRVQEQCFIVEGAKSISELIDSVYEVKEVFGTKSYLEQYATLLSNEKILFEEVSDHELQVMGSFKSSDSAVAIAKMRDNEAPSLSDIEFGLVLDDVRDPGNLGTIIRTADWYGITKLIASKDSTDFYNPKVIAASMGSFTRVSIYYTHLTDFFGSFHGEVFGAFLDGSNLYEIDFGKGGLIIVGNESRGISEEVSRAVTQRITIPRIGKAESLNVATATAIILDNIRRRD